MLLDREKKYWIYKGKNKIKFDIISLVFWYFKDFNFKINVSMIFVLILNNRNLKLV